MSNSISFGLENSEPLSVNITINNSLNLSIPSNFWILLKISITDCASLCSLIKANINEQFTKWIVSKTLPPFLPSTESISTTGVSGYSCIYFSKSSYVLFSKQFLSIL